MNSFLVPKHSLIITLLEIIGHEVTGTYFDGNKNFTNAAMFEDDG